MRNPEGQWQLIFFYMGYVLNESESGKTEYRTDKRTHKY